MSRPILTLKRSATRPSRFWVVWRAGSKRVTKRHSSASAAIAEAERLAELDPDQTFYVLERVARRGRCEAEKHKTPTGAGVLRKR